MKEQNKKEPGASNKRGTRKPYSRPVLKRLGRIEKLTTSGTGTNMELAMGQTAMNMNFFP